MVKEEEKITRSQGEVLKYATLGLVALSTLIFGYWVSMGVVEIFIRAQSLLHGH